MNGLPSEEENPEEVSSDMAVPQPIQFQEVGEEPGEGMLLSDSTTLAGTTPPQAASSVKDIMKGMV